MLAQIKVWEGLDLDVFAHHRVVGGQFFVDEGFVGDHFEYIDSGNRYVLWK